jgi:ADP-ribose pyrophosphatase YjhB (NUDIX family)
MQWHPHKTVATLIEWDNQFLMVEEIINGRLVYNQPAGHLEEGETLEQAALRETLEETAWQVELIALLGIYQSTSAETGICYIRTCYIAKALQHFADRPLDTGIVRALWMSKAEIEVRYDQLRSPVVLTVINDYLAGQHFPLHAIKHVES